MTRRQLRELMQLVRSSPEYQLAEQSKLLQSLDPGREARRTLERMGEEWPAGSEQSFRSIERPFDSQVPTGENAAIAADGTASAEGSAQLESVNARNGTGNISGPNRESNNSPSCAPDQVPPRRGPDLESSRKRLDLVNVLARELATIKQDLNGFCTAERLRKKHPDFILWAHINEVELKELVDGMPFKPKAYAETFTLRAFGITSRETLKKDRKKLKKAGNDRLT